MATSPVTASKIVVLLNPRWRVVEAPPQWPPQWILQRKVRGPSGNRDARGVAIAVRLAEDLADRHCGGAIVFD